LRSASRISAKLINRSRRCRAPQGLLSRHRDLQSPGRSIVGMPVVLVTQLETISATSRLNGSIPALLHATRPVTNACLRSPPLSCLQEQSTSGFTLSSPLPSYCRQHVHPFPAESRRHCQNVPTSQTLPIDTLVGDQERYFLHS